VTNNSNLPLIIGGVADEIRSEYLLGFQAVTLKHPGKYHHVSLLVRNPNDGRLWVSWRRGYFEPR
jgi:hypothetical protein